MKVVGETELSAERAAERIVRRAESDLIDAIAELACRVISPPRPTPITRDELLPVLRALFASGQKLAIENAQLRATLKSVL